MSRGLPVEAMAHVGLKRRTFDSLIRPRVTPIRVGTSLIFDVHDLDRAFDELKAASATGQRCQRLRAGAECAPGTDGHSTEGVEPWADQHGIHPDEGGTWQVDKIWRGTRFRQRGFAGCWRSANLADQAARKLRTVTLHGARPNARLIRPRRAT